MTLKNFLADLHADHEARTSRVRHGQGELTFFDGKLTHATGCLLPDNTLTDAECVLPQAKVSEDSLRVWMRRLPGTKLRRRGRLIIDEGKALLFIDEPDADLPPEHDVETTPAQPNLERDLGLSPRIRGLVRSELFATLLYGALCNTTWQHTATGTSWDCSWRSAGGIVANLRCEGDYMDWYCFGGEGLVDEQVLAEIKALGWELIEAELVE